MTSTDGGEPRSLERGRDDFRRRRTPAGDGLCVVALVGRAGGGKSTVARALETRGARVLEADRIGHEVTDHDPDARAALIAEYGAAVFRADGTLDRKRVAARVFADAAALGRLNALVHPRIIARLRERLRAIASEGYRGVVLVDAALLLDWHFERECDAVVAVSAPESERVARLVASRDWSEAEARGRLAAQQPDAFFAAAADVVLDNASSPETLAAVAIAAIGALCEPCLAERLE